jgi:phosphopantothenoylcysteine synthetase/decarboxylase
MNILITAGNTQTPIDRVRCITNIFTGRTGGGIALAGHDRGHDITLLTAHPEVVAELGERAAPADARWHLTTYQTFDELQARMAELIKGGGLDAVIHTAAVSDYRVGGIYAPAPGTRFHTADGHWEAGEEEKPRLTSTSAAAKIKSDEPELWLRLVRTPKLVDQVRAEWGFRGVLVKFKLEVGLAEHKLLEVAERSRRASAADVMVANTLEGAGEWAFVGPIKGGYQRVRRRDLATRLLDLVEQTHREKANG